MVDYFEERLGLFLGGHPASSNEFDRRRFLELALAGAEAGRAFPRDAFESCAALSADEVTEYQHVYEWIRSLHDMLCEQGRLSPRR